MCKSSPSACFVLFQCVSFYLYLFYYYSLEACLFSNERQKRGRVTWEKRGGGPERTEGGDTEIRIQYGRESLCSIKGKIYIAHKGKLHGNLNCGNLDQNRCLVGGPPPVLLMPQVMILRMTLAGDTGAIFMCDRRGERLNTA